MPHLTIEYSANLDDRADIGALCETLLKTVLETGLFELGAVRVRALRADHYAIADQLPENAFVDLNFRIGKGRTAEEKKRTGEAIFAAAADVLGPLFETPHFALSLEIREIDAELSWKKNAIHPRLRGK
ncbi:MULTISPECIES: 5-carboxymethyl-2-hydroxymuconate Delta-isomerase [unclassified Rhizobium]|uniref:5-carboxymethyl-2-hydroxymuconate Delta-isomerase n=1 Tax=unclassified Rhizobium TaxID=2613769 RepID=UPI001A998AA7|nr:MULTISPECIES: 5-carboxymethyl-2-hydroxymuconate Delta-isomerase [unclassified Rhizobium]MBX5185527.1 5-carboxymethyl-2-hydroxymuconate Delta-isomerase [Rhizobium sp. NZLR5]MBX5187318.1 5-carboxymethyl-2-hydroxymuconate Delta-isomerase [Rhizobium sp. NZLR3b]MBX5200417.1 5-carboxymethyl-2-hydroxymuconate Delta-isomerase [Rhizobium sp. NZLR1]QSZ23326.1 5-carboxymethyl-2-hydroxymuconate Delta-isomerase [Rhizobium sp. NZLR1]